MRSPTRILLGYLVLWLVCSALPVVHAAGPAVRSGSEKEAANLVREALHHEIYGVTTDRADLLRRAAEAAPDFAPAMWHRGFVRLQNEWISADNYDEVTDRRLAVYYRIRERFEDTAESQMRLANWCGERGLSDQERAHLTQVLLLAPEHPEARRRLGYVWFNGGWTLLEEIHETLVESRKQRALLEEWRPEMERIAGLLLDDSPRRREFGRQALATITDADAVGAMETVVSSANQRMALLVIEQLSKIPDRQAALSLARHAVVWPQREVRAAAARKLKNRHIDTYIPAMLSAMSVPVRTRTELFRGRGGRLVYRHTFLREEKTEKQLLVLETAYTRIERPGGDRQETLARALANVGRTARVGEFSAADQNRASHDLNLRIAEALSTATGVLILPTPESWWQWWTEFNEQHVEGEKATRTIVQRRELNVVDRSQPNRDTEPEAQQAQSRQSRNTNIAVTPWRRRNPQATVTMRGIAQGAIAGYGSCFAAGTPVWTSRGPTVIERVEVGDLVLSQNVDTGELAYKPVLRTTLGPPTRLVVLKVGTDQIQATGGHPFWVCGEGWRKARQLEAGMPLHCVAGSTVVSSVETGNVERAYNLVVADFQTYFVGNEKLLCHDITDRAPSDSVVPGLLAE